MSHWKSPLFGATDHRVPAFLVVPPDKGPFAGVIFMHWGFGSRNSFLNEAIDLANRSASSYSIMPTSLNSGSPPCHMNQMMTSSVASQ